MLTWKLWRALLHPPAAHPVYQRAAAQPSFAISRRFLGVGATGVYLLGCCYMSFLWQMTVWLLPFIIVFVILLFNLGYGALWTLRFSGAIARERERNTYDLLCVVPAGALAISWAIAMAQLHRTRLFQIVYSGVRLLAITVILTHAVALAIPLSALAGHSESPTNLSLLQTLVFGLSLTSVFFIDHLHALVLASLVGMVTPTFIRHGVESRWRAVVTFVALQLVGYVLAGIIALVIFPAAFATLQFSGWLAAVSLGILGVAAFLVIRETIIARYWRYLSQKLNVNWAEFDAGA